MRVILKVGIWYITRAQKKRHESHLVSSKRMWYLFRKPYPAVPKPRLQTRNTPEPLMCAVCKLGGIPAASVGGWTKGTQKEVQIRCGNRGTEEYLDRKPGGLRRHQGTLFSSGDAEEALFICSSGPKYCHHIKGFTEQEMERSQASWYRPNRSSSQARDSMVT